MSSRSKKQPPVAAVAAAAVDTPCGAWLATFNESTTRDNRILISYGFVKICISALVGVFDSIEARPLDENNVEALVDSITKSGLIGGVFFLPFIFYCLFPSTGVLFR